MSKRNKHKGKQPIPTAARPTPPTKSGAPDREQVITNLEATVLAHTSEDDLQALEAASAPSSDLSAEERLEQVVRLHRLLELQRQHLERDKVEVDRRTAGIEEQEREIQARQDALTAEDAAISERQKKLEAEEDELLRRQEAIILREQDADAGFRRRNREALAQLEAESETLRSQFARHRELMAEESTAFEQKLRKELDQLNAAAEARRARDVEEAAARRASVESELAMKREALEREQQALAVEAQRLRKLSRDLDLDRELLVEDREALDEKIAQRAAREVEFKDGDLRALTERLEVARAERDRLAQRLAEREEADRRFGGDTPDEVLKRMRTLELEREQLRKALGGRPSAEAAQRLEELERQKELWESDRLKLLGELCEARQEAARRRIAVTELESLRDEKRALESANALLHEAIKQLRAEVDGLVKGIEGKSPFPSCSQMDGDNALQSTRPTTDAIRSLADFAEYVRHRMAWDPDTKKELYYSAEDVRSFIGGLAMSRLHLLQGISGTGKTSLPLTFARAIGAGAAVIEVQAGWRDRQDLIGHFNTFERRFYESEFLQALYRASTPHHRDTPFIIVLDEMNLSHPEQYFANLLSALEQDQHRQFLELMTAPVDPAPRLLADGGKKMPIPPNVWFIGTANHDETTKDFADKTYDRSHVMELPRNRETFERRECTLQKPISFQALQSAFNDAMKKHVDAVAKAYEFLQEELGDMLERRFRVGWGNRLERHLGRYVPVVVAAGGTVGEATDHILATKLLRKIRDRHDNRPEDITALHECIRARWSFLDKKHEPRRSLGLLKQELHRLGHDDV